jgi:hypothetical protein
MQQSLLPLSGYNHFGLLLIDANRGDILIEDGPFVAILRAPTALRNIEVVIT